MSTWFPVHAPVLETSRLRLRGHRKEDHEPCAAMWGDPETTRYIGGRPFTAEESWSRLLRYVGHWEMMGFGYWVVEEKASGEFAGEAGFADYRRDITPALGVPEVGWVLAPRFHGQGYATAAVRAILEWGDSAPGTQSTACIIHPDNAGSVRVAEKCGFRSAGKAVYGTGQVLLFRRWGLSRHE
jgi:RimJ/RimL family protein N-acetyltransferase